MSLFLPRDDYPVYSTCRCVQRWPAGNGQTDADARRDSTFSGLEKSPGYNVGHKLGLRVRPTSDNNHIHGKLLTTVVIWHSPLNFGTDN